MDSTATPKEDAVEEKHDPFSNLKIHSNLELYFRERVFCSKTERGESYAFDRHHGGSH